MAFPFVPVIGGGMALAGMLLGNKQRPMIDPAELERLFGSQTLRNESNALYRMLLHGAYGQGMMRQGALQGSQAANRTSANLAKMGISGTPYGSFLGAASKGYGKAFQMQGQQNLFSQALQAAMQNIAARQNAYVNSFLQQQSTPTWQQQVGSALMAGGSQGLLNWGMNPQTAQQFQSAGNEPMFFGSPWHPSPNPKYRG